MGRGEVGGGEQAAMRMNRSYCLCVIFFLFWLPEWEWEKGAELKLKSLVCVVCSFGVHFLNG